jgi:hypothetical protein
LIVNISLSQNQTENPEDVVETYFKAFTTLNFETMASLLHPEFVSATYESILHNLQNGSIQYDDYFSMSKEDFDNMTPLQIVTDWEASNLSQMGSTFSKYSIETLWHGFEGMDRAYVVTRVVYNGSSNAESFMILIPLIKYEGSWRLFTSANLTTVTQLMYEIVRD